MKIFYHLSVHIYKLLIMLVSPFNEKARQWLEGRKNWRAKLSFSVKQSGLHESGKAIIWMHVSSLGEFEQGRPIIEALSASNGNLKFVISFFSPSGYLPSQSFKKADIITYLPVDSAKNASLFILQIRPKLVIWVKYDYWYHYLTTLKKEKIPVLLVSGIFRPSQPFFKWYGGLHREMIHCFSHLFVQNKSSAALLEAFVPSEKITVAGDTRFDRVVSISKTRVAITALEAWLEGAYDVVVAGSTWPGDEEALAHLVKSNPDFRFIIAPHHVDDVSLAATLKLFGKATLFSDLGIEENPPIKNSNLLIINNIGLLSQIYHYASICYVGGGFGSDGVHNVLEPAAYGKPVIHGPEYFKYDEAIGLIEAGGSFVINNASGLERCINKLSTDTTAYLTACEASKNFVQTHAGSTVKIIDFIYENRLLTNRQN